MSGVSHILNLVLSDATRSPIEAASLFALVNLIAVLFRESYNRMNVWDSLCAKNIHHRLQTIGETRWWSKDATLTKIFGSFDTPQMSLYLDVILSLSIIEQLEKSSSELRAKARYLKNRLLKFETIITAFVYPRVFKLTTPLSKYLQTSGIDLLKVHQLVMGTFHKLKSIQRDFDTVRSNVAKFIDWVIDELERRSPKNNIILQDSFPEKKNKKEKKDAWRMYN